MGGKRGPGEAVKIGNSVGMGHGTWVKNCKSTPGSGGGAPRRHGQNYYVLFKSN